MKYDITILTDRRYLTAIKGDPYSENVLLEDTLLKKALEKKNLSVHRTNWDDLTFDWSTTRYILFRTTWDYFDRFDEFSNWLENVSKVTQLINPKSLIYWNIDKHYLQDIQNRGIRIPNTLFIESGDSRTLAEICADLNWKEYILKPAISGAARHTYRFKFEDISKQEVIFKQLITNESMLIQEFQENILTKGEVAYMVFGGQFSHAVLKKAKKGDFRVQDDFGGTIESYTPNKEEVKFIENAIKACDPTPLYARVDVIYNNQNELCIGEIELIEPELWFRMDELSASKCANAISEYLNLQP